MALNTRLTQNIDLQADGSALVQALGVIEKSLNGIVGTAGSLGKALEGGANAGSKAWNNQLKSLNILIGQAQNLQKLLDANTGKRAGGILAVLDEQALGKKGAAASRLAQDLTSTSTAADILEKRLAGLNKRFADLTMAGRTVGQRDLAKQFNTQNALKDVQGLEREFQKLNGQAGVSTGTKTQQENMARLRTEITAANNELAKMGQNYRRTDFSPQVTQLRQLTDQYRQAVVEARRFDAAQPGQSLAAKTTAVGILNQTDSQRLAAMKRASSQYQFPTGISQTVSQQSAEKQLTDSLQKRLRLLQMIQQAQDRDAPTRSVERLNEAYKKLSGQLGENFKRLTQVNTEIEKSGKSSFLGQLQTGLDRVGLITGASIAVSGVYAVMNAVKQATQFVVEYEAALKQLQAISGSTDTQMGVLAKSIGEVGRQSNFSILDITKAATVIAQAGYSAEETGKVLQAATTLSTASGSSPTESVDVLTSALGAFQLQAGEAGRVVDVLVTALNQSKLSMTQMGQAIQYAGATAKQSGISIDELATITASLANAGIKSGSTIGTGMRQLIVELQEPTEKFKKSLKDVGLTMADVDVKSMGFANVVKKLTAAGFGASAAYNSFETRAAAAFLAFQGQIGTYDDLALAIANGGTAATAQATAMDSLGSQWQRLQNDLGVLVAGLAGPFVDALKTVVSLLADFVEAISDIVGPIKELINAMGIWGNLLTTIGLALAGFAIAGPMGAAIGGVIGLLQAIGGLNKESDELATKTANAKGALDSSNQTVTALDEAIHGLITRQGSLKDGSVALQTETTTLANRFNDLYSYLGKASGGYNELLNAMLRYRGEALKQAKIDAQILQTDTQNTISTTQGQLDSSRYDNTNWYGGDTQIQMGSLTNRKFKGGVNRTATNYKDAVTSALQSDDIAQVSEARNAISRLNNQTNNGYADVLKMLEDRLVLIRKIAVAKAQNSSATQQIGLADARLDPRAQGDDRDLLRLQDISETAINDDKGGNRATLSPAIQRLNYAVTYIEKQIKATKEGTARYQVLTSQLAQAKGQLANLMEQKRQDDEADAKIKPVTARKGTNLTGAQIKADLERAFPGIIVYSETPRPLEEQRRLYNNYINGKGPRAAKPGTSDHGSGHAVDFKLPAGVSLDNVTAFIESLGVDPHQPQMERDPTTGRVHGHIGWRPKASSFQTRADKKEDTSIAELKKVLAAKTVNNASASVNLVLDQAKAGIGSTTDLKAALDTAIAGYIKASLGQYDSDHPTAGLSAAGLKLQQEGRAELVEKLKKDAEKYRTDLFKNIADVAQKAYNDAAATIKNELETATYNNEAGVRTADQNITRATSQLNKDHVGAGTSYYLQQQKEAAQLNTDRLNVSSQRSAEDQQGAKLQNWKATIDAMPDGEAKTSQLTAYTTAFQNLNTQMRETAALQQTINDRTGEYTDKLPLKERLAEAAAGWANNSGIMQDWSTVMENNVGPALDMMSSTLTDVFSKMMQGSMGIKGALKSIISAIGQFVVQLIAKALALMAIKWFLRMIGVELVDGPGGVTLGKKMDGGPIGDDSNIYHKRLNGGPITPKKLLGGGSTGYISQGVFNKDTVPILGARGEYMLRKTAVDSLGLDNVNSLNRHGAHALNKMSGAVPVPSKSHQEMNVYVVKQDEKPQLGPKDIVLAISDDMLQGGVTKQLVRKVSQGAI